MLVKVIIHLENEYEDNHSPHPPSWLSLLWELLVRFQECHRITLLVQGVFNGQPLTTPCPASTFARRFLSLLANDWFVMEETA